MKRLYFLFAVAFSVGACSKAEVPERLDAEAMPIAFNLSKCQLEAESRALESVVDSGETHFGNYSITECDRAEGMPTRIDQDGFTAGDQIGVYLYYNYWFDRDAESKLLDDATVSVTGTGITIDPQKLWTFSSLGGDVPISLHAEAYYPKSAAVGKNYPVEDGNAYLVWNYDPQVDLLLAKQAYADWQYYDATSSLTKGEQFKKFITEADKRGGVVDLEFKHQMATLSFYIYKANISDNIDIERVKINYTCSEGLSQDGVSTWSDVTSQREVELSVTAGQGLITATTASAATQLTFDDEFFLPPTETIYNAGGEWVKTIKTVINRVQFSFVGDSGAYTYAWHPHIENMKVKNYKITFELDPDKQN